jgi:oligoendopeptidase F
MAKTIPPRSEVPVEHTWDASSIYPSHDVWEAAFQQTDARLTNLSQHFEGKLGSSAGTLADWFETSAQIENTLWKLYVYASMFSETDTADSEAAAREARVRGLYARVLSAIAFAEPELLQIPAATLTAFQQSEPRLAHLGQYFAQLERRKPHIRSAEVEALLGSVQEPFSTAANAHSALADADLTFKPAVGSDGATHEITQGTISALLTHPDREVRRTAWENYADAFLAVKNSIGNTLAAGVQQNVFMARARNYPSALEAATGANFIPSTVFHNLIATFRKNLPTWHRYWELRRKALGYDTLHVYDCKAPLSGESPVVPFEQAMDWIEAGMKPLGNEYVSIMSKGVREQRWVDIYPNKNKRMGAFSSGASGTHPFILMNYNDDVFSMSTLAHELGHSMHSYYTWQTQPLQYSDYSIFVAEVASNFDQALVRAHLLESNPDSNFQIALLEEAMSNYHRYFFVMPTLARFELELHERVERGDALTADDMIALMTELFSEGYGGKVEIDANRIGITWAQFPTHLYSNFYVYQYATGISAANTLANGVLRGDEGAVERYLNFLRAGSSVYPLDALKSAGVDLTQPEAVDAAFALLTA